MNNSLVFSHASHYSDSDTNVNRNSDFLMWHSQTMNSQAKSPEALGARIKQLRGQMTQAKFGKSIGTPQANVSDLENGSAKGMHGKLLLKIAEVYRVRPRWIMYGELPKEDIPSTLTPEEQDVIRTYMEIDPALRRSWLAQGRILKKEDTKQKSELKGVLV